MAKRNTKLRRHGIMEALRDRGEVSVEQLTETYQTSEVTIRKDLAALEEAGLLLRRYGGAVALPTDLLQQASSGSSSPQKTAIARRAAAQIKDHYRIIIDSGSTCIAMLPYLSEVRGLVVMTNSLSVAQKLLELENEPTVLMTGGTWDKRSESFQGQQAELMLRQYNFDQLFIGADGIDVDRGTTSYNEFLALSQAMAEVAREVIVLAESAKASRKIPNLELRWSQIHCLVTDTGLTADHRNSIAAQDVQILLAEND